MINESIEKINGFIIGKSFFEFSVKDVIHGNLLLVGSSDIIYYHEIEIYFKNVSFICCSSDWHVDTEKKVIEIISGQTAYEINSKYRILQGQVLIKLNNEDNIDQWIACESINSDIKIVKYNF